MMGNIKAKNWLQKKPFQILLQLFYNWRELYNEFKTGKKFNSWQIIKC